MWNTPKQWPKATQIPSMKVSDTENFKILDKKQVAILCKVLRERKPKEHNK